MAKGRYIRDYKLIETVDSRGRIHTEYEYIGDAYCFVSSREVVRRGKIRMLACSVLGWICFICALIPNSQGMRTLYISLPFAFAALPLGVLTEIALSARSAQEPLERRQAEKFGQNYPPAALALVALCAAALIGQAVRRSLGGSFGGEDGWFTLCAGLLLTAGAAAFAGRGAVATGKKDPG